MKLDLTTSRLLKCLFFAVLLLGFASCENDGSNPEPTPSPPGKEVIEYDDKLLTEIRKIEEESAEAFSTFNVELVKNAKKLVHCWSSANATPGVSDSKSDTTIQLATSRVERSCQLKDLKPNKTYYVRAFVAIENKIVYGKVSTFKTKSPVVTIPENNLDVFPTLFLRDGFQLIALSILFVFFGTAIALARHAVWMQVSQAKIEQKHRESELQLLLSQLSPHFLFNTLNNIYGISLTQQQRVPQLLLKLSELLRYSVYETREEFIPLKNELLYLKNYIDFEKIQTVKG